MRGIRFVFLLAVPTKRLFFIDWPQRSQSPFPLTLVLLPVMLDWRYTAITIYKVRKNPNITSIKAIPFKKNPKRMEYVAGTEVYNISASEKNFETLWNEFNVVYFTNRISRSSIYYLSDNTSIHIPKQLNRYHIWLVNFEQILKKVLLNLVILLFNKW